MSTWERLAADARQILELNELRSALDLEKREARGALLGGAVALEADAVQLVLVGYDKEARTYLEAVRRFALRAYELNDRFVYEDPDGRNLFGRYMATRLASTGDWALDGARSEPCLSRMIELLEELVRAEPQPILPSDVIGPLLLHYCQAQRFGAVLEWDRKWSRGNRWSEACRCLVALSRTVSLEVERSKTKRLIDEWFAKITDSERLGRAYAEEFTADDVVGFAEVRARFLYGVTDFWAAVKSIREPRILDAN